MQQVMKSVNLKIQVDQAISGAEIVDAISIDATDHFLNYLAQLIVDIYFEELKQEVKL